MNGAPCFFIKGDGVMTVAGIDASTTASGVSIMRDGKLVFYTLIKLKEKDTMKRIRLMLKDICEILDKYDIRVQSSIYARTLIYGTVACGVCLEKRNIHSYVIAYVVDFKLSTREANNTFDIAFLYIKHIATCNIPIEIHIGKKGVR